MKNNSIIAERVTEKLLKPKQYGVLAQLGEHLPYKQRVIGSSPIGPIFMFEMKENVFMRMHRGVFLCFGIICIYGTLTKKERIAMME